MKTKIVFIISLLLIPLVLSSQEGTDNKVVVDFEIGKFILLDLEELDRFRELETVNQDISRNLKQQIEYLNRISNEKTNQISLLQDTNSILKTQLEAEKLNKPKSNWLTWSLAVLAAFGTGFILGQ